MTVFWIGVCYYNAVQKTDKEKGWVVEFSKKAYYMGFFVPMVDIYKDPIFGKVDWKWKMKARL